MKVASDALSTAIATIAGDAGRHDTTQALAEAMRAVAHEANGANADAARAWVAGRDTATLAAIAQRALGAVDDPHQWKEALQQALGLTQSPTATADMATTAAANKLASALRGVVEHIAIQASLPSHPQRMSWVATRQKQVGADVAGVPAGKRILATLALDASAVAEFVNAGIPGPDATPLCHNSPHVRTEDREVLAARHRDVNNVIWTEVCYAIADKLRSMDISSILKRYTIDIYGVEPNGYGSRPNGGSDALDEMRRSFDAGALAPIRTSVRGRIPNLGVSVLCDELGAPLAAAIACATQLVSDVVAADSDFALDIDQGVRKWANFRHYDKDGLLRESIESIGQALTILLAKKPPPPFDTPRDALREVARSGLVTRFAMAPFGLLGAMMSQELGPTAGCTLEPARGDKPPHLRLPVALSELMERVSAHRHVALTAGKADWTETVRGCPVAGRGPITDADGTIRMSNRAGLTVLVDAVVEVVEKTLDALEAGKLAYREKKYGVV